MIESNSALAFLNVLITRKDKTQSMKAFGKQTHIECYLHVECKNTPHIKKVIHLYNVPKSNMFSSLRLGVSYAIWHSVIIFVCFVFFYQQLAGYTSPLCRPDLDMK